MLRRMLVFLTLSLPFLVGSAQNHPGGQTEAIEHTQSGYVSYYTETPTVFTTEARIGMGDVSIEDLLWAEALIATLDCRFIGKRAYIWIEENGTMPAKPTRAVVFDCARRDNGDGARHWMSDSNIVFEVDWFTAVEKGVVDRTSEVRGRMAILR